MRIPLEIYHQKKSTSINEQGKEVISGILSKNWEEFISELKFMKTVKTFFQTNDPLTVLKVLDKFDECFEICIEGIKNILKTEEKSTDYIKEIEAFEEQLRILLNTIQDLINTKQYRIQFKSLDRVLDIMKATGSIENVGRCFQVVFSYFQNDKITKKDYSYVEKDIIRFFYLCKFALDHQNLYNTSSVTITHYMHDDPRFDVYYKSLSIEEQETITINKNYVDNFLFEYISPNPANKRYDQMGKEEKSNLIDRNLEALKVIRIEIDSLKSRYGEGKHICEVVRDIIKEYSLNIEEDSPLFDALLFRVRIAWNINNYRERMNIIGMVISSLMVYVCFLKVFSLDRASLINSIFTTSFHFSLIIKDILNMFYFQAQPGFHTCILDALSGILSIENKYEYKDFLNQLITQYSFLQKLLKDFTSCKLVKRNPLRKSSFSEGMIIEESGPFSLLRSDTQIISPENATDPSLLEGLLLLLKKGIKLFFLEEENQLLSTHMYSILSLVTVLVNILETPIEKDEDGYSLYTFTSLNYIGEILWGLLPNHEIVRDFHIIEKITKRLESDLVFLNSGIKVKIFCKGQWIELKTDEQVDFVAFLLKQLDCLFIRRISSRTQMAPTLARKIADSKILELVQNFIRDWDPKINEKIFFNTLTLVVDIVREVPTLISSLLDIGIMKVLVNRIKQEIPNDVEAIPMLIYFVNMLYNHESGVELEQEQQILKSILGIFIRRDFIDTLTYTKMTDAPSKLPLNIASELQELISASDKMRERVLGLIEELLDTILRMKAKFMSKIAIHFKCTDAVSEEDYLEGSTGRFEEEPKANSQEIMTNNPHQQNSFLEPEFDIEEAGLLVKIVLNFAKFLWKLALSQAIISHEEKINKFNQSVLEKFLRMMNFPLIPLLEKSLQTKTAGNYFKPYFSITPGISRDLPLKLQNHIMSSFQVIEKILGQPLEEINDLSKIIPYSKLAEIKGGNFSSLMKNSESGRDDFLALIYFGHLHYLENLLESLKFLFTLRSFKQIGILSLLPKFFEIFRTSINEYVRQEGSVLELNNFTEFINTEKITPADLEKYFQATLKTLTTERFKSTYFLSLKKLFLTLNKQAMPKLLPELLKTINSIMLSVLLRLRCQNRSEQVPETPEQWLGLISDLTLDTNYLVFLNDMGNDLSKKKHGIHPSVPIYFYEYGGFELIWSYLEKIFKIIDQCSSFLFSEIEAIPDKISKGLTILLREALNLCCENLISTFKVFFLIQKGPGFTVHYDGNIVPEQKLVEYLNTICLNQTERLNQCFCSIKQLPFLNKVSNSKRVQHFKSVVMLMEMLMKKIHLLPRIELNESTQNKRSKRGTGEGSFNYQERIISQLISMGYSRENATEACDNLDTPTVESALEWLSNPEAHEEKKESTQNIQFVEKQNILVYPLRIGETKKKEIFQTAHADYVECHNKNMNDFAEMLIRDIYFFEGYERLVAEYVLNVIERQANEEQKRNFTHDLMFKIMRTVKHLVNKIFKKFEMKIGIKGNKTLVEALKKNEIINPSAFSWVQGSYLQRIMSINTLLPVLIEVAKNQRTFKNFVNEQYGLEFLRFADRIFEKIDDFLLIDKTQAEKKLDIDGLRILEDLFFKIIIIINEILSQTSNAFPTQNKKNEDEHMSQRSLASSRCKRTGRKKLKSNSKPDKSEPIVEEKTPQVKNTGSANKKDEDFPEKDLKKRVVKFVLSLLSSNTSIYTKHKKVLITGNSIQAIFNILIKVCTKENENVKLFIEKKGFVDLLNLRQQGNFTGLQLEGILELFFALVDKFLLTDEQLLSILIESEIKNLFYKKYLKESKEKASSDQSQKFFPFWELPSKANFKSGPSKIKVPPFDKKTGLMEEKIIEESQQQEVNQKAGNQAESLTVHSVKIPIGSFKAAFVHFEKNVLFEKSFEKIFRELCSEEEEPPEKTADITKRPASRKFNSTIRKARASKSGEISASKNVGENSQPVEGTGVSEQSEEEKKNENSNDFSDLNKCLKKFLNKGNNIPVTRSSTIKNIKLRDEIDIARVSCNPYEVKLDSPKRSQKQNILIIENISKSDNPTKTLDIPPSSKSGKKSKQKEKSGPSSTGSIEIRENDPTYIINFQPKSQTLHIIHLILERIVRQFTEEVISTYDSEGDNNDNEATKDTFLINHHILLKTLHLILRKFHCLTPIVTRFNCTRYLKKKLSPDRPLGNLNTSQNSSMQINFLTFLTKVISYYCVDHHRNLIFELCFDKHLICEINKGTGYVNYAFDIRKRVLGDIFSILEGETEKAQGLLTNSLRIHNLITYSSLHLNLLPLREVARMSLKFEESFPAYNFGKVYSELLKAVKVEMYYVNEHILPFLLEPLSMLLQYSLFFALDKAENSKPESKGKKLEEFYNEQLMPYHNLFIFNKDRDFSKDWEGMMNPTPMDQEDGGRNDWGLIGIHTEIHARDHSPFLEIESYRNGEEDDDDDTDEEDSPDSYDEGESEDSESFNTGSQGEDEIEFYGEESEEEASNENYSGSPNEESYSPQSGESSQDDDSLSEDDESQNSEISAESSADVSELSLVGEGEELDDDDDDEDYESDGEANEDEEEEFDSYDFLEEDNSNSMNLEGNQDIPANPDGNQEQNESGGREVNEAAPQRGELNPVDGWIPSFYMRERNNNNLVDSEALNKPDPMNVLKLKDLILPSDYEKVNNNLKLTIVGLYSREITKTNVDDEKQLPEKKSANKILETVCKIYTATTNSTQFIYTRANPSWSKLSHNYSMRQDEWANNASHTWPLIEMQATTQEPINIILNNPGLDAEQRNGRWAQVNRPLWSLSDRNPVDSNIYLQEVEEEDDDDSDSQSESDVFESTENDDRLARYLRRLNSGNANVVFERPAGESERPLLEMEIEHRNMAQQQDDNNNEIVAPASNENQGAGHQEVDFLVKFGEPLEGNKNEVPSNMGSDLEIPDKKVESQAGEAEKLLSEEAKEENKDELGEEEQIPEVKKGTKNAIDFESLGLSPNFLEKNDIDKEFFEALPEDLKMDVILQYIPTNNSGIIRRRNAEPVPNEGQMLNIISSDFMEALPNNLRQDIETQTHRQNEPVMPNLDNENANFIASLNPELRDDILLNSTTEFLNTLPQEYRDEARRLRERDRTSFRNIYDNLLTDYNQIGLREPLSLITSNPSNNLSIFLRNATGKSLHELLKEDKTKIKKDIRQIHALLMAKDRNIVNRNILVDEKLIETVLEFLYTDSPSFSKFPYPLLRSLALHPVNEYKIMDCFMFLLRNEKLNLLKNQEEKIPEDQFPLTILHERNFIMKKYQNVYKLVSLKILYIMMRMTKISIGYVYFTEPIPEDRLIKEKSRKKELESVSHLRQRLPNACESTIPESNMQRTPLFDFIGLLSHSYFSESSIHLQLVITILAHITKKMKINDEERGKGTNIEKFRLDKKSVQSLCQVISNDIIDEEIMKKLSSIVFSFCLDKNNLELLVSELREIIFKISLKINMQLKGNLENLRNQFLQIIKQGDSEKESYTQFLDPKLIKDEEKMKKFRARVSESQELITLIGRMESQVEDETKIHKIFKVIRQLFEKFSSKKNMKKEDKNKKKEKQEEESKEEAKSNQAEASSNQEDLSESRTVTKNEVKKGFHKLLCDDELYSLWVNITELFAMLYEAFLDSVNVMNPIIHKLTPTLECFFIIYKIMHDEEEDEVVPSNKRSSETSYTGAFFRSILDFELKSPAQSAGKKPVSITMSNIKNVEDDSQGGSQWKKSHESFDLIRAAKLDIDEMFNFMCEKNKAIINKMINLNPNLLNDSFSMIIKKVPYILDFKNKKDWFQKQLKKLKAETGTKRQIRLKIRRKEIFLDSYHQMRNLDANQLKGKISIEFSDEEGMDLGGLTKEWFLLLSKEIFNPGYALFKLSANGVTFQPSPASHVHNDHLDFFKFIGKLIGKALFDGHLLECFFTRSFYKHMLGQPLSYHDIEDIDPEYYKNLKWILENDVTPLELTFSYEKDEFGTHIIKDLKPDGRKLPVTEENKKEYIQLVCYEKMAIDIEEQIRSFLSGFHELIPSHLVSIFSSRELELMISGLPDIDIQDLKENTEYTTYTRDSKVIKWFWELLESLDQKDKAAFLQFITGTSKVPLQGFKELKHKFNIQKCFDINKLPTAHTCFNQLDLPDYQSKDILREKLMFAICEGKEGFGFQ